MKAEMCWVMWQANSDIYVSGHTDVDTAADGLPRELVHQAQIQSRT
jgi:hypothetical protein